MDTTYIKNIVGAKTSAEACELGGLNFEVASSPVEFYTSQGDDRIGKVVTSDKNKVLYRKDTGAELAVVGSNYEIHQVSDVLSFVDKIAAELPGFTYTQAGLLNGGREFFIQAELGDGATVKGDVHQNKLMIHSGFGHGVSTKGFPVRTRIRCWNQVQLTTAKGKGLGFRVNHTRLSMGKLRELIAKVGGLGILFDQDDEFNRELARRQARPDVVKSFLEAMIPNPEGDKNPARAKASRDFIEELMKNGKGSEIAVDSTTRVGDTLYGFRNAITEWTNHHRTTRSNGGRSAAERRFCSTMFGDSSRFIATADEILRTIVQKNIIEQKAPGVEVTDEIMELFAANR